MLVLAAVVRIERAELAHFWFDEAFSWRLVEFDGAEIVRRVAADNHSPLYFLLLKGWTQLFGSTVFTLRMLSVVFGLVTVAADYALVAENLDSPRRHVAAAFASLLVTLGPFQLFASYLARMYSLATALTALSTWALLRALARARQPGSTGRWIAYGVLASLLGYAQYLGVLVLAAHALVAVRELSARAGGLRPMLREGTLRAPLATAALVVVSWLPWLGTFVRQSRPAWWMPPLTPAWWASNLCPVFFQLYRPSLGDRPDTGVLALEIAACAGVLLALALAAVRGPQLLQHLAAVTLVPIVLTTVVSVVSRNVFFYRYLFMAQVAFLAGLAVAVSLVRWRLLSGALGCAAALAFAWRAVAMAGQLPPVPDADEILAQVVAARAGTDAPVIAGPFYYLPMRYRAPGDAGLLVYAQSGVVPSHLGASVLRDDDHVVSAADLATMRLPRVLVVRDAADQRNAAHGGPRSLPSEWRLVEERRVTSEAPGTVTVAAYATAGQ